MTITNRRDNIPWLQKPMAPCWEDASYVVANLNARIITGEDHSAISSEEPRRIHCCPVNISVILDKSLIL